MHAAEQKVLADIEEYGWSVMLVHGDDGQDFGYTIGIHQTFGQPELFICGLSHGSIHALCNQYGDDVKAGKVYREQDLAVDWFEDSKVQIVFANVHQGWKPFFLGRLVDLMNDRSVPVLQAIWSDGEGRMPGQEGFDPNLEGRQFFLWSEPEY